MKEGGKAMEVRANQDKSKTTKGNLVNITTTIGKMLQTREAEHPEEGGAAILDRAVKTTPPSADTLENRRVSRNSQVDNSPTTPPTPSTTIVAVRNSTEIKRRLVLRQKEGVEREREREREWWWQKIYYVERIYKDS